MRIYVYLVLSLLCASCAVLTSTTKSQNGAAPTEETIDYFHGEQVLDPYRWMEDSEDSRVEEWVAAQTKATSTALNAGGLLPKIKARLIEIAKTSQGNFDRLKWAGGKLFAIKLVPPANQPALVVMPSYDKIGAAETLIDPNVIDPTGALSIDWYVPSHDGRYLAVSMSKNGTEAGDLYLYDLTKRAPRPTASSDANTPAKPAPAYLPIEPVIPNVNRATGGGDLAWRMDNKGFFYTRYPDGTDIDGDGALFQKLYYHKLGKDSDDDKLELGKDFDRIEQIELEIDDRSGRLIATVQMGRSGHFKHYLRNPDGKWQQLSKVSDEAVEMTFAPKGGMFLLSRESAPRGRLHFLASPKIPLNQAKRIVPQSNDSMVAGVQGVRSMLVTQTRLYLVYQLGGPSEIRVFDHQGKKLDVVTIPDADIGSNLVALDGDEILFSADGFTEPKGWYRYDGILGARSLMRTALSTSYGIGYEDVVVDTVTVESKDGAKVPLFIVHKSSIKRDGERPTILFGDGGFGRAFTPTFSPALTIWLNHGGVAAFAAVRGGGEFGEGWHRAGMLVYKQNSIDDFVACAGRLIGDAYTVSSKLALSGYENGGLLVGAAMVQQPDMAAAVVADRGVFDMLRSEFTPSGEVTIGEYGSVNDELQFKAMLNYSPYHNVEKRTGYPATLLISGANDKRVAPWHSRKFAAQLQAANSSQNPILYKEISNTGSGHATPFMQKIEEEAEKLAFLFKHLAVQY